MDRFSQLAIKGAQMVTKSTEIDSVMHVLTKSYRLTFIDSDGREWVRDLGVDWNYWNTTVMQRDTVNRRFLFSGGDVLYLGHDSIVQLGEFMTAKDVLFISALDSKGSTICPRINKSRDFFDQLNNGGKRDTIGYIPNVVLKSAQERIITAFNTEDYTACYALFDSAMIFVPTTSAEYLQLKAEGIE